MHSVRIVLIFSKIGKDKVLYIRIKMTEIVAVSPTKEIFKLMIGLYHECHLVAQVMENLHVLPINNLEKIAEHLFLCPLIWH